MTTGVQFPDGAAVCIALEPAPLAQRLAAAKELLYTLDAEADIDATGAFEESRIMVSVKFGVNAVWSVDFHVVWPEPQLNNQHLSVLKLVSWSAWGGTVAARAKTVRARAETRLRAVIADLSKPGGTFDQRLRLIGVTDSTGT